MGVELYRMGEYMGAHKTTPQPEVTLPWARKWCRIFGVDLPLVMALAEKESTHDPHLIMVRTGAYGLGQQRHKFAEWKIKKIVDEFADDPIRRPIVAKTAKKWHGREKDLFDPDLNLMLTVWELRHMLDVFDGQVEPALASYNLGLAGLKDRVKKGFEPAKYDYVTKVLAYRGKYQHLA